MSIQGDFNSWKAQSIALRFEKCEPKEGSDVICKSNEEIMKWLQRKFIVTMTNQRRFRLEEFSKEGKVVEEARTVWIPFNSQLREEIVYQISLSTLELQDKIWQWGGWTKEDIKSIFRIDQSVTRPYEFPDNVHTQITYELNLDMKVIDRQVYSVLDWLGDIGGLVEALFFIGQIALFSFTFGQYESMMVSSLF